MFAGASIEKDEDGNDDEDEDGNDEDEDGNDDEDAEGSDEDEDCTWHEDPLFLPPQSDALLLALDPLSGFLLRRDGRRVSANRIGSRRRVGANRIGSRRIGLSDFLPQFIQPG